MESMTVRDTFVSLKDQECLFQQNMCLFLYLLSARRSVHMTLSSCKLLHQTCCMRVLKINPAMKVSHNVLLVRLENDCFV